MFHPFRSAALKHAYFLCMVADFFLTVIFHCEQSFMCQSQQRPQSVWLCLSVVNNSYSESCKAAPRSYCTKKSWSLKAMFYSFIAGQNFTYNMRSTQCFYTETIYKCSISCFYCFTLEFTHSLWMSSGHVDL